MMMTPAAAAPCRRAGAPPETVVERVAAIVAALASDESFLLSKGLTPDEYHRALPAAIERLRGSLAASNAGRRKFLVTVFEGMRERELISKLEMPRYGDDTVYRLTVEGLGDVAVIQKGCPDGAHSSVRWTAPEWATETYLWWLCSSTASEPGEHVAKGINRLRQRFFSEAPDTVDGVIFHNELCGSRERPCPKADRSITLDGLRTPPPCIFVMPERNSEDNEWNWDGRRQLTFPSLLLAMFGINDKVAPSYVGHVGFQKRGSSLRTTIASRFGSGRSTTFRS
jgi:hypothetical protein